jgi:hypothetical protein
MKFSLTPAWTELDELLRMIGLTPVPFHLAVQETRWNEIEEEVGLDELEIPADGQPYLDGTGRPVFIYIRDVRLNADHATAEAAAAHPEDYTRVHLTECSTISDMRRQNRFQRYVRTNSRSGALKMHLTSRLGSVLSGAIDLRVCRNCLNAMDWQGYRNKSVGEKKRAWRAFDRAIFLETYTPSFVTRPHGHEDDPPDTYSTDWSDVSRKARQRSGFRCEHCNVHVGRAEAELLDVHHRDHRKVNNSPANLEVLCKLCHADIHSHYKPRLEEVTRLRSLRREQGISG